MTGQPLERAERARMRDAKTVLASVIWCRHGATDYHPDRFYEAGDGPDLNAAGVAQAESLALWLGERRLAVDALYVSPCARTRQTATPIARALGATASVLEALGERSMGQWNGRLVDDVKQDDPEGWRGWKQDPVGFTPSGGESLATFGRRIEDVLSTTMVRHPGGMIIFVTHVGPIRAALVSALGCPPDVGKRFVIEPASATRIDYTPSWPNLVFLNVHGNLFTRGGSNIR